jgi:ribonuclease T1
MDLIYQFKIFLKSAKISGAKHLRYLRAKTINEMKILFLLFSLLIGTFMSCRPAEKKGENTAIESKKGDSDSQNEDDSTGKPHKRHKKHRNRDRDQGENSKYASENRSDGTQADIRTGDVPTKALKVLKYVRENGVAMDGYVGGRRFGNFENLLPKKDASGRKINYQEWDVNPKVNGKNRGAERLITGSDGKAYYTNDHYGSFVEVDH